MDLEILRNIIAIEELRSFSRAAEICHMVQSALSQQVAKLERKFGVSLFIRTPHGVIPTEAGIDFIKRSREILKLLESMEASMYNFAGLRKGTLNLGIITSLQCINFGRMLSDFSGCFPNISINIHQGGTYKLINELSERLIDVAFLNNTYKKMPENIMFHKLGTDRYSLAVSKNHKLAEREIVSLRELRNERFIFHNDNQVAAELCFGACKKAGFVPHIVCRSESPTTVLYMVLGGLGIAFLPSEEFKHRSIDGVKEVRVIEDIIKEVGICWRKDAASPIVDKIVEFAMNYKKSNTSGSLPEKKESEPIIR